MMHERWSEGPRNIGGWTSHCFEALAVEGLQAILVDLRLVIIMDWWLRLLAGLVDGYSFLAE